MSDSNDNHLDEFERHLARLISEHAVSLNPDQIADVLQDHVEQLLHGNARQVSCRRIGCNGTGALEIAITYHSVRALKSDIPQILEVGALMVPCALEVELLTRTRVLLGAKNVPQALTFDAQIVHKTDEGIAAQLEAVDAPSRKALLSWPEKMRGQRATSAAKKPTTAALAPDSEVMFKSGQIAAATTQEGGALVEDSTASEARTPRSPTTSTRSTPAERDEARTARHRSRRVRPHEQRLPNQPKLRSKSAIFDSTWDLSQTSFDEIIRTLVHRSGRAILELDGDARRVQWLVESGKLYEIQSAPTSANFSLGVYLQRKGRISAKLVHELFSQVEGDGITEAQALLQRPKDLARRDAVASIRSHLMRMFVRVDVDEFVHARLFDSGPSQIGQTATSVPLAKLLYLRAKVAHREDPSKLDKRFSLTEFRHAAWPSICADDLGLNLAERQLLDSLLADPCSLDQILERAPMDAAEVVGALAGFEAAGLLEWQCAEFGVADTAGWARGNRLDAEMIDDISRKMSRTEDPFALLGLHWTSYDSEVKRRYETLRSILRDINLPVGLERDHRRRAKELRVQLREAYDRIFEARLRREYRDQYISKRRQKRVAEELETLGEQAMSRRRFASSLDFYQRLLELLPEHRRAGSLLPKLLVHVRPAR